MIFQAQLSNWKASTVSYLYCLYLLVTGRYNDIISGRGLYATVPMGQCRYRDVRIGSKGIRNKRAGGPHTGSFDVQEIALCRTFKKLNLFFF